MGDTKICIDVVRKCTLLQLAAEDQSCPRQTTTTYAIDTQLLLFVTMAPRSDTSVASKKVLRWGSAVLIFRSLHIHFPRDFDASSLVSLALDWQLQRSSALSKQFFFRLRAGNASLNHRYASARPLAPSSCSPSSTRVASSFALQGGQSVCLLLGIALP